MNDSSTNELPKIVYCPTCGTPIGIKDDSGMERENEQEEGKLITSIPWEILSGLD